MTQSEYRQLVDERLEALLGETGAYGPLGDAMKYSVTAGGKRLRPIMHLMSCSMLGGNLEESLDTACAIEMIHTYSLIHDDLPAMDDDELRRGRPTNHVVYGEGMAILAGDALLNYSVQVALKNALRHNAHLARHIWAIDVIFSGSGTQGMLSGQAADIALEGKLLDREGLDYIHRRKTGALISAAAVSGAVLGGASAEEAAAVDAFGNDIGLAFQIIDDVLDVRGSAETLGKNPGKDEMSGKTTFVSLYGAERAAGVAKECTDRACHALSRFGHAAEPLVNLAVQMVDRNR